MESQWERMGEEKKLAGSAVGRSFPTSRVFGPDVKLFVLSDPALGSRALPSIVAWQCRVQSHQILPMSFLEQPVFHAKPTSCPRMMLSS